MEQENLKWLSTKLITWRWRCIHYDLLRCIYEVTDKFNLLLLNEWGSENTTNIQNSKRENKKNGGIIIFYLFIRIMGSDSTLALSSKINHGSTTIKRIVKFH